MPENCAKRVNENVNQKIKELTGEYWNGTRSVDRNVGKKRET